MIKTLCFRRRRNIDGDVVGVKGCVQTTKFAPARGPLVKGGWLGLPRLGDSLP